MELPVPLHTHTTADAIVQWYEQRTESPRAHLGASVIGRPCDRSLWYSFRWATDVKFPGRILRLFSTGQREEGRVIAELRGIGAEVHEVDPESGEQFRFSAVRGHFGGSCDAVAKGLPEGPKTWAVVEMKTHNNKSFTDLKKNGVKKSKPEHASQTIVYMGLAELTRALYLAVNKDTDEIYTEWIHFDEEEFKRLISRATRIIDATEPPAKINDNASWYQCKFCDHQSVCHEGRVPRASCRTCLHATPVENGAWHCARHNDAIPFENQLSGCEDHLLLPVLVGYATALDAGDTWVLYARNDTKSEFYNGHGTPQSADAELIPVYKSSELSACDPQLICDALVENLRREFDGELIPF